jgi:chromosome segregation ATPase
MEEGIKNRIILILVVLNIIFLVVTGGSCNNSIRQRKAFEKEMAIRLDLDEKISKLSQDTAAYEGKVNSLNQALEEEKAAHQATKKALVQEQLVNQSLKEEIERVTKLKEALEEDLKEALVTGKSKASKK